MKTRTFFTDLSRLIFSLIVFISLASVSNAAGVEAGRVISVSPGAFVERDSVREPLALSDAVLDTDTIVTDATGRARILFQDDGAVALGPNTSLALIEVLPNGEEPVFKAHIAQGFARFITGKIVEQNPGGFAVSTPEGTAGIRGTIFALQTGGGHTTIYVVNASRDVVMNGISVPSGNKMVLPGGSPVPMTPSDVELTQSIASALPSSQENETTEAANAPEQSLEIALDESKSITSEAFADLSQSLQDSLAFDLTPTEATYTGQATTAGAFSNFEVGFTVNLTSGDVYNAYMSGYETYGTVSMTPFAMSGGTGLWTGVPNYVTGFTNDDPAHDSIWYAALSQIVIDSGNRGDAQATVVGEVDYSGGGLLSGLVNVYKQ